MRHRPQDADLALARLFAGTAATAAAHAAAPHPEHCQLGGACPRTSAAEPAGIPGMTCLP